MQQLSKEELEKQMKSLSPEEKLEYLRNLNKMVSEMNEAVEEYLETAEK